MAKIHGLGFRSNIHIGDNYGEWGGGAGGNGKTETERREENVRKYALVD